MAAGATVEDEGAGEVTRGVEVEEEVGTVGVGAGGATMPRAG